MIEITRPLSSPQDIHTWFIHLNLKDVEAARKICGRLHVMYSRDLDYNSSADVLSFTAIRVDNRTPVPIFGVRIDISPNYFREKPEVLIRIGISLNEIGNREKIEDNE